MNKLNPMKVGIAVGGLLAVWHAVWSLLIAVGWAQSLLDFIFNLHMITPPYQVKAFSLGSALLLIVVTFIVGTIIGNVFAYIWNHLHR